MKRPVSRLLTVSFLGLTILIVIQTIHARSNDGGDWSLLQKIAMQRVIKAQYILATIRAEEISENTRASLNADGVLDTALVGVEWSHLVSTQGSLDAKIASTDPRWAALFIAWFERAGAGPDRPVAIGSSASFPALLLAARIAAEVLGAEPVIVASLSSSNYGATVPEFDLWKIEEILLQTGIVKHPIRALTPGGEGDRVAGFAMEDAAKIFARLDEITESIAKSDNNPDETIIYLPETIEQSSAWRTGLLLADSTAIFVNIGGHAANLGTGIAALALPHGYISPADANKSALGSISITTSAIKRGIPVINALNIQSIMMQEGLSSASPSTGARQPVPIKPYSWPARFCSLLAFFILAGYLVRAKLQSS